MPLKMTYNVDMCFCIDATGSMGPVISQVKQNALSFYKDVTREMERKQKSLDNMRVRVIVFRDYMADEQPMMASKFFQLPAEAPQFAVFLGLFLMRPNSDVYFDCRLPLRASMMPSTSAGSILPSAASRSVPAIILTIL